MSNETKRNVFERALDEWYGLIFEVGGQGNEAYGYCEFDGTISKYEKDYDAALPDDLPVIPKDVGEYLKTHRKDLLGEIFWKLGCKSSAFLDSNELYIVLNSDTFARAWLLGAWCVEETGEIVKLEVEK